MKLPSPNQIKQTASIMLFVLLALFVWRLHAVGLISFDYHYAKNYDKKEDKPDMVQLSNLLNELTHGLPKNYKTFETTKPKSIARSYSFINLTDGQKSQLMQNLKAQSKWIFREHKKNRDGYSDYYCFDQFELIIGAETLDYKLINKPSGEYTYVHVRWWDTGECRSKFLQRQYQ